MYVLSRLTRLKESISATQENMRKLKAVFLLELQHASETGLCKPNLYVLVRSWYEAAPTDVSINETHNSYVRRECERNRHIALPLLSSRCNARYDLKLHTMLATPGQGKQTKRWSNIRPNAFKVLQARRLGLLVLCCCVLQDAVVQCQCSDDSVMMIR